MLLINNMNLTKLNKFIFAIGLQLLIVAAIIIFKYSILAGGTSILLEIAPVDPRDPLRGDYVTFQYAISDIERGYFSYPPKNGDTVYIPLRQGGKYWSVTYGASKTKPTNSKYIFIKAKVVSGGTNGKSSPTFLNNLSGDSIIGVEFGIEEYFIPEGTGRNFNFWNKEAHAKVLINDSGNAVLKQIYIEDKPWP